MSDERRTLTCIACRKRLSSFSATDVHPNDGLAFDSAGHYGSTFFDPMDGTRLVVAICDSCLERATADGLVFRYTPRAVRASGTYEVYAGDADSLTA